MSAEEQVPLGPEQVDQPIERHGDLNSRGVVPPGRSISTWLQGNARHSPSPLTARQRPLKVPGNESSLRLSFRRPTGFNSLKDADSRSSSDPTSASSTTPAE